jgi:hypothetical protein
MSFELTQKVIRNRLNISPCEKMVLAILADKIDHKGYCYPSFNTLAKLSGYSRSTIIRTIKSLIKQQLITVKKIPRIRNKYSICEKNLDLDIESAKNKGLGSVIMPLALVPQGHHPSITVTPDKYHSDTLVNKVVDKEVSKSSKVDSKNKSTQAKFPSIEKVVKKIEMKIEDLDLTKFEKTDKKKMNPIDIWRNAVVDFQNEHTLAIVDLKFTQGQAGMMNKVAKKLEGGFKESLENAVWNWDKFVKYVLLHAGGTDKPLSPNIHFFVFHSNLALLFYQKKSDTKVKNKSKLKITKKVVTDAHTKALLKAAGKDSGT